MKLYLSGKMSGEPNNGFDLFNAEASRLRALGYEVVNPAELEVRDTEGWLDWMARDILALKECQGIALLHNWLVSPGAQMEFIAAKREGLRILMANSIQSTELPEDVSFNLVVRGKYD